MFKFSIVGPFLKPKIKLTQSLSNVPKLVSFLLNIQIFSRNGEYTPSLTSSSDPTFVPLVVGIVLHSHRSSSLHTVTPSTLHDGKFDYYFHTTPPTPLTVPSTRTVRSIPHSRLITVTLIVAPSMDYRKGHVKTTTPYPYFRCNVTQIISCFPLFVFYDSQSNKENSLKRRFSSFPYPTLDHSLYLSSM